MRRHPRALEANFIPNPVWRFTNMNTLVRAHPLGGCPLGEDYWQGGVDEFGRVFTGKGDVHNGLFVADRALIPAALNVNPLLTISALTERIAERLIKSFQGEAYPAPPGQVTVQTIDPMEAIDDEEADLERIFTRVETLASDVMVNSGQRSVDLSQGWSTTTRPGKAFSRAGTFSTSFLQHLSRVSRRNSPAPAPVSSD